MSITRLNQAEIAAQQENWSQVIYHLQQLLLEAAAPTDDLDREPLLPLALATLDGGDFQQRWDVAKLFPSFGAAAIAPLTILLHDDDAELESRWFAARILGELGNPIAIQALAEVLQSAADDDLSAIAADALTNLGPTVIPLLAELLADATTRLLAVQALGQIRQSDTITPLLTVVNDPDRTVRTLAIAALSSFHDARIPPVLVTALKDPDANVRQAAVTGLGIRSDLAADLDLVRQLSDVLWDINLGVCQSAAIALGRLGTDAAVASLDRGLHSPHTPIPLRLEIIRALAWTGQQTALGSLQQALVHPKVADELAVQREMVAVLGRWSSVSLKPAAAQILIDTLHTPNPPIASLRAAIAHALGQLNQAIAIEPLINLLVDAEPSVRFHAIAALKQIDPETTRDRLEVLQRQADVTPALKQGVAIALAEWTTR